MSDRHLQERDDFNALQVGERPLTLREHYDWARYYDKWHRSSSWNPWLTTADVLWAAFCVQWVALSWCVVVGNENGVTP